MIIIIKNGKKRKKKKNSIYYQVKMYINHNERQSKSATHTIIYIGYIMP